jgi:PiT family inorganic phosphate transporter
VDILIVVIVTALVFDFTNGFHDTANAMATSIATGALRPKVAVGLSAVLNLAGAFLSVEVARTISSGVVDEVAVTPAVVFGALVGAILWNLTTWFFSLPSSSSHALFGGLIGATWVASGMGSVHFAGVVEKVLLPAVAAPVVAAVIAALSTFLSYRLTDSASASSKRSGFRTGQIASASLLSLAHGTNDAQKTMGIITLTMISAGALPAGADPPTWVIISAGVAIALGTYLGGWRIINTLGKGVTDIEGPQGFAAQTASAAVVLSSSHLGFALSTTHVASGSVIGAGLGRRSGKVRWRVVGRMVLAWTMTLPAAAVVGAIAGRTAIAGQAGVIVVAVVGIGVAATFYLLSRRRAVTVDATAEECVREEEQSASRIAA